MVRTVNRENRMELEASVSAQSGTWHSRSFKGLVFVCSPVETDGKALYLHSVASLVSVLPPAVS